MTKEVLVKRIKQIGGLAIGVGVSTIVGNATKCVTPETVKGFTKVCVGIGSFALGAVLSDATVKYTNGMVDEISEMIDINLEPENASVEVVS